MHPWPSCNGRTSNAVSMSMYFCPITFIAPLPASPIQLTLSRQQTIVVPPHVGGGHKRKVRGTSKKFHWGIGPPHLQIASDATASVIQFDLKRPNFALPLLFI